MPYRFCDKYQFVELLGRGGMGAVFKAYDLQSSREVAVKVVQKIGSSEDRRSQVEMFENEQSASTMLSASKLNSSKPGSSSNFIKVLAFESQEPQHLVMEYVPWNFLADYMTQEFIPPLKIFRIGHALLTACTKMHHINIVHRDLKPDNIFIKKLNDNPDYTVKIFDLGVWALDKTDAESIFSGQSGSCIVGTIPYMSPEQMRRDPVGCLSDLHSVGSILWELACGEVPYPVDGTGLDKLRQRCKLVENPPKRPEYMPEGLYKVLARLLAHHPSDRYANAYEAAKELKDFEQIYLKQQKEAKEKAGKLLKNFYDTLHKILPCIEVANGLVSRFNKIHNQIQETYDLLDKEHLPLLDAKLKGFETSLEKLEKELEPLNFGERWLEELRTAKDELDKLQTKFQKYQKKVAEHGGELKEYQRELGRTRISLADTREEHDRWQADATGPLGIKWKSISFGFTGLSIILLLLLMTFFFKAEDKTSPKEETKAPAISSDNNNDNDSEPLPQPEQIIPKQQVKIEGGTARIGRSRKQTEKARQICLKFNNQDTKMCLLGMFTLHPEAKDIEVKTFFIDKEEYSQEKFLALTDEQRQLWKSIFDNKCGGVVLPTSWNRNKPLTGLTFSEAQALCVIEGGRLPTASEFIWATTDGGTRNYPWGDEFSLDNVHSLRDSKDRNGLKKVRSKEQADFYNILGNAGEWVWMDDKGKAGIAGSAYEKTPSLIQPWAIDPVNEPCKRQITQGFRCAWTELVKP